MRRILYENPGIAALNLGDHIISESTKRELDPLFHRDFIVEVSTHLPLNFYYGRRFKDYDYKLVLGSNLLNPNPTYGYRKQWAISPWTYKYWGPAVLVGAGWSTYREKTARGQLRAWRKVLHPELLHSVRDGYTYHKMLECGFENVIYTGCPTTWSLTPEHMQAVPRERQNEVVFTLTDYRRDPDKDRSMILQLLAMYQVVHFWPQGIHDNAYLRTLLSPEELDRLQLLAPSLAAYDHLLETVPSLEYVGTRLHGGIRALQKFRRTLIISIDNRAREMQKDKNLPVLERTDMEQLTATLAKPIVNELKIDRKAIARWKQQFV